MSSFHSNNHNSNSSSNSNSNNNSSSANNNKSNHTNGKYHHSGINHINNGKQSPGVHSHKTISRQASGSLHYHSHAHSIHPYDDITNLFQSLSTPILPNNGIIHPSFIPTHTTKEVIVATTGAVATTLPIQVVTKSKSAFLQKYIAMIRDGPSKLKIVTDFDFTITKYHILKPQVDPSNTDSTIQDTTHNAANHPAMNTPNTATQTMGSPISNHLPRQLSHQRLRSLSNMSNSSNGSLYNLGDSTHGGSNNNYSNSSNNNYYNNNSVPVTPNGKVRLRSLSNLSSNGSLATLTNTLGSNTSNNYNNSSSNVNTTIPSIPMIRHRGISCHGVLEDCHLFHKDYHEQSVATFKKYYPIEIDPHITYEAKYQYMIEWVNASHNLLLHKAGLTFPLLKQAVREAVKEKRIEVRAYTKNYFETIKALQVPLLIFSAGISDILEKVLEYSFEDYSILKDIHVVSNKCIFHLESNPTSLSTNDTDDETKFSMSTHNKTIDSTNHHLSTVDENSSSPNLEDSKRVGKDTTHRSNYGWGNSDKGYAKLVGFHEPLIHVLNKRASSFLSSCSFFHSSNELHRHNVILLGDSPGDILMTDGMNYDPNKCLKIGFLNDKITERFDHYLDIYDVVILGDEAGFEVPLEILDTIGGINRNNTFNLALHEEMMILQSIGMSVDDYDSKNRSNNGSSQGQNQGHSSNDGVLRDTDHPIVV